MKIAVSTGKGGTEKTFIATNLALLLAEQARAATYIDCDVEEPNGHLFLKPEIHRTERMTVGAPLRIDPETCTACRQCADAMQVLEGAEVMAPFVAALNVTENQSAVVRLGSLAVAHLIRRIENMCEGAHLMPLGWDDIVPEIIKAPGTG